MKVLWKAVLSIVCFVISVLVAAVAIEIGFGEPRPGFVAMATLVIVAPVLFLIWRKRQEHMRKVFIIAIVVLLALGGGIWWLAQDPAGSEAYSVIAETDESGTRKCGLVYLDTLAKDAAGNDLYFKVTASTELLEGKHPVALFGVEGLRVTEPESKSGENLRIADASLAAGELDTRERMKRPSGDVDAFFAISTEADETITLPIDMLEGSRLTVRLADEAEPRSLVLPGVGSLDGSELYTCFQGMQARAQALAAAEKSGADGKKE